MGDCDSCSATPSTTSDGEDDGASMSGENEVRKIEKLLQKGLYDARVTTSSSAAPSQQDDSASSRGQNVAVRKSQKLRKKADYDSKSCSISFTRSREEDSVSSVGGNEVREIKQIVKKETKIVNDWREIVIGMLVITAFAVGVATFLYLSREDVDNFTRASEERAEVITKTLHHDWNIHVATANTLAESITANSIASDSKWPFVTVPHFEVYGAHVREIFYADLIGYSPFVTIKNRATWEDHVFTQKLWITDENTYFQGQKNTNQTDNNSVFAIQGGRTEIYNHKTEAYLAVQDVRNEIYRQEGNEIKKENGKGPYAPFWQMSPPVQDRVNYNLLSSPVFSRLIKKMKQTKRYVLSEAMDFRWLHDTSYNDPHHSKGSEFGRTSHISTVMVKPIFEDFATDSTIVGFVLILISWDKFLTPLILDEDPFTEIVMKNSCGQNFTYHIRNGEVVLVGEGDRHNIRYDKFEEVAEFSDFSSTISGDFGCKYTLHLYPTVELREATRGNTRTILTIAALFTFFIIGFVFKIYDRNVQKRNTKIVNQAAQSYSMLCTLFPSNVRDRVFEETKEQTTANNGKAKHKRMCLENIAEEPVEGSDGLHSCGKKPIADLFPNATVLFSDIVGFTAWSSVREPEQIFILLETIYNSFDEIAKRRRVFKVETIGDCYVAVTGLPEPRKDHAVVMARFARECLYKVNEITNKLQIMLGPDTADLCMRFGMHSGPVTAGVLRGGRSRFQLFGDTVNFAAFVENKGKRNHIHLSDVTAGLLVAAGKQKWVKPRKDKINARGKGTITTYWLTVGANNSTTLALSSKVSERNHTTNDETVQADTQAPSQNVMTDVSLERDLHDERIARLIDWNISILKGFLKQIVARRNAFNRSRRDVAAQGHNVIGEVECETRIDMENSENRGQTVLEEVREIITLPKYDSKVAEYQEDPETVDLGPVVEEQLHDFVTTLSSFYHENPFHNFEHASHVTMSIVKLLSRIVAPSTATSTGMEFDGSNNINNNSDPKASTVMHQLHDHTYGITSDPLTQFAVVFSGLIHDVDHMGVPNAQLVKENTGIAKLYKNQSVAEQNSVDIAWNLLCEPEFAELRGVIYSNNSEFQRFRQLVVNCVMATDIVDKELKELRNARWSKAFASSHEKNGETTGQLNNNSNEDDNVNRKATIVIEHLIQASDVAHTMQHWHIYRKWNERFFQESYKAYKDGRAEKDPIEYWYKGELGFFDFYIIPLAKKLSDCGVFGVSSDEYLNYAISNRQEWEQCGEEVLAEMVDAYNRPDILSMDMLQDEVNNNEKSSNENDSSKDNDAASHMEEEEELTAKMELQNLTNQFLEEKTKWESSMESLKGQYKKDKIAWQSRIKRLEVKYITEKSEWESSMQALRDVYTRDDSCSDFLVPMRKRTLMDVKEVF